MPRKWTIPSETVAYPAIGVRHEPSRTVRNARSAASAVPVSSSAMPRTKAATGPSEARAVMAIAPCPTAGGKTSIGITMVAWRSSPNLFKPASARSVASTSPSDVLRNRVSTLPRNSVVSRSGLSLLIRAARRRLAVPITAPFGNASSDPNRAEIRQSRASSRGR